MIAKGQRRRFLERLEADFDFDFILVQEWSRQSDLGVDSELGELKIVSVGRGESHEKTVAIICARRWQHHHIRVRIAEKKLVVADLKLGNTTTRLISSHLPTGESRVEVYAAETKKLFKYA